MTEWQVSSNTVQDTLGIKGLVIMCKGLRGATFAPN